MKLLLTSKGLTNDTLKQEFIRLLGTDVSNSTIAYVPTAGLYGSNDKSWFVDEMNSYRQLNPAKFMLIDFETLDRAEILERMAEADAIVSSGGNMSHLMHMVDKKDLRTELKHFAETKLYSGISASTHVVCHKPLLSNPDKINRYAEVTGYTANQCYGWVDFYLRAHYTETNHLQWTDDILQEVANTEHTTVYGIDNASAVSVEGDEVKVISEGNYQIFEPQA